MNYKMDQDNTLVVAVVSALGTLLASLGLPHLYRYYFGHLSEKKKYTSNYIKEIQNLKMRISQIVTSVDMLLIVIKDQFQDSPAIQSAIKKVEEHLHERKDDSKDGPTMG